MGDFEWGLGGGAPPLHGSDLISDCANYTALLAKIRQLQLDRRYFLKSNARELTGPGSDRREPEIGRTAHEPRDVFWFRARAVDFVHVLIHGAQPVELGHPHLVEVGSEIAVDDVTRVEPRLP